MIRNGFGYTAFVPQTFEAFDLGSVQGDKEFTSKYGYGISTLSDDVSLGSRIDPNQAIFESLDGANRQAYLETLYGRAVFENAANDDFSAPPISDQGCTGFGVIDNAGEDAAISIVDFSQDYAEGLARLEASDEIAEVRELWARCMNESGFEYSAIGDVVADLQQQRASVFERLQSAEVDLLDPETIQVLFETTDISLQTSVDESVDLAPLRLLQRQELLIAAQDNLCFREHVETVYDPLKQILIDQLIEAHSDGLTALQSAVFEQ